MMMFSSPKPTEHSATASNFNLISSPAMAMVLQLAGFLCGAYMLFLSSISLLGFTTLLSKSPMASLVSGFLALAGPELVCLVLGVLSYVLVTGHQDIKAYFAQRAKEKEFLETGNGFQTTSTSLVESLAEDEVLEDEDEENDDEELRSFRKVLFETSLAVLALLSVIGAITLAATYPAAAAVGLEELSSLAGPEVLMGLLGALTYVLFSGQNFLTTYWTYYDALFPGRELPEAEDPQAELARLRDELRREKKAETSTTTTTTATTTTPCTKKEEQIIEKMPAATSNALLTALADGGLDTNTVAEVFLGLELRHMGRMAVTCRAAKAGIWEDTNLWLAVGGPGFALQQQQQQQQGEQQEPAVVREQFRTWVYGLDGPSWSGAFRETAHTRHQKDVFDDASYLLGGLQQVDGRAQVEAFGGCLCEQLKLLDAGEELANQAAIRLMAKAWASVELLGEAQVQKMQKAFDESTEYARVTGLEVGAEQKAEEA